MFDRFFRGPLASFVAPAVFFLFAVAAAAHSQSNPPRAGFDVEGSDPRAIEIADEVMKAMGGREAWDAVAVLEWTMFDRVHAWDRWGKQYRLQDGDLLVIMDLESGNGDVWRGGERVTDEKEADKQLTRARSVWINDSYWFVMPYKLKDSGVTLGYLGDGTTEDGVAAHVLELTFEGVGDTPENKYHVYVDKTTNLVAQWAYFPSRSDDEPRFKGPWTDWKRYGGVMLAEGRGNRRVTGIRVHTDPQPDLFRGP